MVFFVNLNLTHPKTTYGVEIYRESELALKWVRCPQCNCTGDYTDSNRTDEDVLEQIKEYLNLDSLVNLRRSK